VDEFWWGLLFVMFYIPFMFLWGFTLIDIFLRKDLHAWSKVLWALVVLFVPLIGVLVYFITRPKDYDSFAPATRGYDSYTYDQRSASAAGPAPAPNDIAALQHMHDGGVLSDAEFDSIRGRLPAT
jgi:hypothetical protein